jgi:ABC-type glycerol-3-phosphate transport system substrate-binding protein
MRRHRLAGLLAVIAIIGTACGGGGSKTSSGSGSQEKVTLNYWGPKEGYDNYSEALIKAFEAKYPNIHIKVTTYPEANYQTKIDTALAAGKPPDLGAVGNLRWQRAGKVLPLNDMVREQKIDLSTYNKSIIGDPAHVNGEFGCSFQGKLYCLGSYLGAVGVFYNQAMFKAAGIPTPAPWPPMSIDQFVDTACRLTDKAKGVWGGAYGYPETLLPWETEFSKDGRTAVGIVNGPTAVHAFDVMAQGIRRGCAPSLNTMDPWEQGADYFSQGKLAMVVTDLQSFKKIENAKIDYGVTHPPTPQGVEPFLQTWTDVTGVFAGTKHQKEAELFIAFQTTQGQRLRVQVTGDMPISTAVAKETNWAGGILGREEALEVVPHARPAVFIPNRWDTVGALDEAYDQIVGGKPAQQALNDAAPKVQADLEKAWRDWDKGKG